MQDLSGTVIKSYELRECIGSGGFGVVYRAYQSSIGREVAVKIVLPRLANHPDFIRRFETEAQLIARLEHPHIIPLYDYWRDPDGAYLVMRWLRGGSLADALRGGPFDIQATALLLDQVTSALALAHRNQVIHRDLKPANVLLDEDGNAYLADFGIAKDLSGPPGGGTQADAIIGSPDYLSPEQARSEPVSPQTDIYSLGVMLCEVLTGQHPFPGITPVERMYKHLNEPLPVVTNLPPEVAEGVNSVIQKATAKDPTHRYADAQALSLAYREAAGLNPRPVGNNVVETFTRREQEIFQRIIAGQSNKQIAQELGVTVATVKWYVRQVFGKLHVQNRAQAIMRARELKLFVPAADSGAAGPLTGVTAFPTDQFAPENPYKGLRAFQAADSRDFFGREALTDKLVKRLGETGDLARFLAVIGPSGSGKSSLVKAGLIPALGRGALPGSEHWFVVEMLPGAHPLDELEVALTRIAANQSGNLREHLQRDERGLLRVAQLILPNDGSQLILVIDQFEEVFTLLQDEAARVHFLNMLYETVADPRSRVRIILTLRADFYDRPLLYPEFGELVRSRMETVLPLSAEELERAIARPAERVGAKFEAGLVTSIVSQVNYQPGALPLLQYALTELFEGHRGRILTHEAYQAIGGTVGALARRADELYGGLEVDAQAAAQQMFLRLVTLGEGVEDTRRRVPRSELMAIAADEDTMDDLIDTYAAYRLLSLDHDPATRSPTVEVAHEAILREWQRLRGWLNDSRHDIRLQRLLATAAAEWFAANRDDSFLLRGSRLEQFQTWAVDTKLAMTPKEQEYLDASIAERERQAIAEQKRQVREKTLERRSRNFLRGLVAVLLLATLGALGLTAVAVNQSQIAQRNANAAQQNLTLATSRELAAAAVNNLTVDPGLSLLLAFRAVKTTFDASGTWTREAEEALHRALGVPQALQVLQGHTGALYDVVYSPDRTRLATASEDGTAKLWDANTGKELMTFHQSDAARDNTSEATSENGGGHQVYAIAFSPDSTRLATGSHNGTAVVWNAGTGQMLLTFLASDPSFSITAVAFSPDGTQLAVVATKLNVSEVAWEVKAWSLATGAVTFSATSGTSPSIIRGTVVTHLGTTWGDVAFSPDGRLLALGVSENVELWNVAQHQKLLTLVGHTNAIQRLAFSPDGTHFATTSLDGTAKIWDIKLPLELGATTTDALLTLPGTYSVAFSPDGSRLATASADGTAKVWDANSGALSFTLTGHSGSIRGIAFSPDGTRLATAATDKTVRIWAATPGGERFTLSSDTTYASTDYSSDGTRLAVVVGKTVQVLNALTGEKLLTFTPPTDPNWAAFSPDGKRLVTSADDMARVWDATTGELLVTLSGHTGGPNEIRYSPDGTRIATAGLDKIVRLWDAATGKVLVELSGHTAGIHCLGFSRDGKFLASGGDDQTVMVWDLTTNKLSFTLPVQGDLVRSVLFSPDGKRIVIANQSESAEVWDIVTHQHVMTLGGHPGAVISAAFSPDGKFIATVGGTIVKLWDAATGVELLTLYGHTGDILDVTMSPDSRYLVTNALDNTLRSYILPMNELLPLAQSRLKRSFTLDECRRYLHVESCPAS